MQQKKLGTARFIPFCFVLFLLAQWAPGSVFGAAPDKGLQAIGGGVIRALIIGIDKYSAQNVPDLAGAVADARDLARTLKKQKIKDITLIIDKAATRTTIIKALKELAARARPQDLVIITYAGHGAQETELVAGAEADGLDEFLVLANFDTSGTATSERLLDDELFALVAQIAKSGARIILLADACYGGGITKSLDPRGGALSVRGVERVATASLRGPGKYYIAPGADQLQLETARLDEHLAVAQLPRFTFLSAVDDKTLVPEFDIPGEKSKRGAASYVFARALEGYADRGGNRDGVTSRSELIAFLRRRVKILTSSSQHTVGLPQELTSANFALFAHGSFSKKKRSQAPQNSSRFSAFGDRARPSGALTTSRLFWDKRTGDVVDSNGSILAFHLPFAQIKNVRARVEVLNRLTGYSRGRTLDVLLSPSHRHIIKGEWFNLRIKGLYGRYLIILNIAGNGAVQYLFPKGNADPLLQKDIYELKLRAGPPFGSDTLITIAMKRRSPQLEHQLQLLAKTGSAAGLDELIEEHLTDNDRIGIATFTTRQR